MLTVKNLFNYSITCAGEKYSATTTSFKNEIVLKLKAIHGATAKINISRRTNYDAIQQARILRAAGQLATV